jgi:hypothetical protein
LLFSSPPSPSPPLLSLSSTGDTLDEWERQTTWWRERGGGRGWARSWTIGLQESLVHYKSFNTHSIGQRLLPGCNQWPFIHLDPWHLPLSSLYGR